MKLVFSDFILGYKNFKLLGTSLKIQAGSFVALIGPNGCGKSAFLNSVSRITKPHLGTIKINGQDILQLKIKELAQLVTLLPQSPLAPHLSQLNSRHIMVLHPIKICLV